MPLNGVQVDADNTSVMMGKSIGLKCLYNLRKNEKISTISWFHNRRPIYQFGYNKNMPKETLYTSKDFRINASKFLYQMNYDTFMNFGNIHSMRKHIVIS